MSCYVVRPAKIDDCEVILQMSKELAEFENLTHQVQTTVDILKKDGFGEYPKFQCLVAEQTTSDESGEAGSLVGYSLYYYAYATWQGSFCFMEDLYVRPHWRGKGVGTGLWARAVKEALAQGCVRLEWTALYWNKSAVQFYKSRGGYDVTETETKHLFRMTHSVMEDFVAQSGL